LALRKGDDAKLRIRDGVVSANVKRADGTSHTLTRMLGGAFEQITSFDAGAVSPTKRAKLVKQLYRKGHRQVEIASMLGVSQATVSLDLKR
jgi:DNA-binding NarL/FixJ family response regulator